MSFDGDVMSKFASLIQRIKLGAGRLRLPFNRASNVEEPHGCQQAMFNVGERIWHDGATDVARPFFDSALGIEGNDEIYGIMFVREFISKGQYAEALPSLRAIIDEQPDNEDYRSLYAACLYEAGYPLHAVRQYELSRRYGGGASAFEQFGFAKSLQAINNSSEAMVVIDNAIELAEAEGATELLTFAHEAKAAIEQDNLAQINQRLVDLNGPL